MSLLKEVHGREIDKVVEKQMRNWELSRLCRVSEAVSQAGRVCDFICISRAVGAQGEQVAAALGEKLRWPVYDRQLLQAMAGDDRIREQLYASLDERDLSWVEETFRSLTEAEFRKNDYFHRLSDTVLCVARKGPAIFVGRAVDLILPRKLGLRVRIVAPRAVCIHNYAQAHQVSAETARAEIERIEKERADFVRRYFRVDPLDESRYDLVINEEHFTLDQTVGLIAWALCTRMEATRVRK